MSESDWNVLICPGQGMLADQIDSKENQSMIAEENQSDKKQQSLLMMSFCVLDACYSSQNIFCSIMIITLHYIKCIVEDLPL